MPRSRVSVDILQRAVDAYLAYDNPLDAAHEFGVDIRTIKSAVVRYAKTGSVDYIRGTAKLGRKPTVDSGYLKV